VVDASEISDDCIPCRAKSVGAGSSAPASESADDYVKSEGNLKVPPGVCEQTDVVIDATASNSDIPGDCIKHEGEKHEVKRVRSEVAMSVVWDNLLSRALISVEHRQDAIDGDLSLQAQPEISASSKTLVLRWDAMRNEAVVSLSPLSNAKLDSQLVDGPLRRRQDPCAGRFQRILDEETPASHKVNSPQVPTMSGASSPSIATVSDSALSPKELLDDDAPEIHEANSVEKASSGKTLSAIWLKRHQGNGLAARRAAALTGADTGARICVPHRLHSHGEERELRELLSIGRGAALTNSNSSTGTATDTIVQWQHSPKRRHKLLVHNTEAAMQSALERMEALVQEAEQRAETAALRIASLHAASDEPCSDLESARPGATLQRAIVQDATARELAELYAAREPLDGTPQGAAGSPSESSPELEPWQTGSDVPSSVAQVVFPSAPYPEAPYFATVEVNSAIDSDTESDCTAASAVPSGADSAFEAESVDHGRESFFRLYAPFLVQSPVRNDGFLDADDQVRVAGVLPELSWV
jgi:hypothetical protein